MSRAGAAVEDLYPLSPLQEGLLFHALERPGADPYVVQLSARVDGGLDPDVLRRALDALSQRHPALRTSLVTRHREPLQAVHARAEIPLAVEDLRDLGPRADDRARALLRDDRARGFDLARPPLARALWLRLPGGAERLVWTFHHVLVDGWSVALLLDELCALYGALCDGAAPRRPPPPPYRDYIRWLAERDPEEAERAWQAALRGAPPPPPLPFDRGARSSAGGASASARARRELSAEATAALTAWARAERLTLSTLAAGAWALVLAQHAEADDVLFGVTVSGRPPSLPGAEHMVGLFINTLPARVPIPPDAPLVPWLAALQAAQAQAREHGHLPLPRLRALTGLPPGLPFFESLLVFESYPTAAPAAPGAPGAPALRLGDLESVEETSYPLTLVIAPAARLRVLVSYDPARFTEAGVHELLRQLTALLERFPRASACRLRDLPLDPAPAAAPPEPLDPLEPLEPCLHQLVEAQADRSPGATAIVAGDEPRRVTYRDLDRRANQLARRLLELGLRPEDRAGVHLDRSPEQIVAVLAILKAGAAFLPLDPALPPARLARLVEGARPALVITAADLDLPPPARALCLPREADRIAALSDARPDLVVRPDQLAYVLHTSGSTGAPRGVAVAHRALASTLAWRARAVPLGPGDVVLQAMPLSFDPALWEIFGPLAAGACVALGPAAGHRDPRAVASLATRCGVTHMQILPTVLRAWLDEGLSPGPRLRRLITGGEPLPADLHRRATAAWSALVGNHYGPTEAALDAVAWTAASAGDDATGPVPIGAPIDRVRAHVLDRWLRLAPPGVPGELYLGGPGLARGYLGRPAATAMAFIPDPTGDPSCPGERLYRTGDRARRRPDGDLELLGRADRQVKIRGLRVELGEIEAALLEHPDVREAAVTVAEGQRLVAHLAFRAAPVAHADLRAHLARTLPEPLLPHASVAHDALPRTPSGKIDLPALRAPAPDTAPRPAPSPAAAPEAPTTALLAALWGEVLGLERPDPDAAFFDLGGHSLLAVRLLGRVQRALAVQLPLRLLFDHPTLRGFAAAASAALHAQRGLPALPLTPLPPGAPRPASLAQEALFRLVRGLPPNGLLNMPLALQLSGDLDPAALSRAVSAVLARHEILRARIADEGGPLRLDIAPPPADPCRSHDLSALPPDQRVEQALLLLALESSAPFDLAGGPLARFCLVRLAPGAHLFLVVLHHLIGDGRSMHLLLRDLAAHLEGRALPPLPLQYADHAAWQRRWLDEGLLERQQAYWLRQLAGGPPEIPWLRARDGAVVTTERLGAALPGDTAQGLRALGRREGASLFMTLLAALAAALHATGGPDDLWIATLLAGRTRAETEELVGLFLSPAVLRLDLSGDPPLREVLRRAREVTLDAYAHADLPFEQLLPLLEREGLSRAALARVALVHEEEGAPEHLPGLEVTPLALDPGAAGVGLTSYDLVVITRSDGAALSLSLKYTPGALDPEAARALLDRLAAACRCAVERPGARLSELRAPAPN